MSTNLHQQESQHTMQLAIQGKQIDLGDSLRSHVAEKIQDINHKFFNHATFANVTFSREGHGHGLIKTHISMGIGKNIMVMADAVEGEIYLSFETAVEKTIKQLRRYKSRLRDHHGRLEKTAGAEGLFAKSYVLADEEGDEYENDNVKGDAPVVIAEMSMDIQKMSVSDAVMRMDLTGQNFLLFRNPSSDELNLVYRRPDGNVGWIDPAGNGKKQPDKTLTKPNVRVISSASRTQAKKPARRKPQAGKKKPAPKRKTAKSSAAKSAKKRTRR